MNSGRFAAGIALAVLFVAGLVRPGAAGAQETAEPERIDTPYDWIDGGFRLGAYGGYIATNRGEMELGPGSTALFGGRLRARVSSPLSIEIGVGYGSSDRYIIDPRLETGPAVVDTTDTDWLLIEGGFQIALTGARTLHRIQPYFVLTGGVLQGLNEGDYDALSSPGDLPFRYEIGTAGVIGAGVGLEWLPFDGVGFGFEVRDHLWRIATPDGYFQLDVLRNYEELGLPAPRESQWTHNFEFSISGYYYF